MAGASQRSQGIRAAPNVIVAARNYHEKVFFKRPVKWKIVLPNTFNLPMDSIHGEFYYDLHFILGHRSL